MIYIICQIFITIFSIIALYLVNQTNQYTKYGCIFALLAAPFWFYSAAHDQAWGILLVNVVSTGLWFMGFWNYWIRKNV